jgi:hypothetical protein
VEASVSSKRKAPIDKVSHCEWSAINKRNSAKSPWRKAIISARSAECQKHFRQLAEQGDTRRVPRPELD